MNRKRTLAGLVLAILLLSLLPAFAAAQTPRAPVETHIWEVLEAEGQAEILVVLKAQADVEGARLLATKEEKGAYVYQQLTAIAAQTQPPLRAKLDKMGLSYRSYWIQNMFKVVATSPAQVNTLAAWPEVDHIEYYYQPMLDIVPVPAEAGAQAPETIEWNIQRVNADDVWSMGITGAGAVIGDLDTGVQWDHPALKQQYRGCIDPPACTTIDHNYNWYDGGYTTVPTDYDTHGTHTMGTIIGSDLPGDPINAPNAIGMAPGARWLACPGIGSPYVGPFECFQFFMAPTDLYGNSPDPALAPHVISNSWSSAGTNFHPAIYNLYMAGIFFSKSAGNTGPNCSTITNPGQWPEVTAAAAFNSSDNIASFSSRGPVTIDHELVVKPDIAAPGVNVRSSIPGNSYTTMQGTSMACPHVTGAVALLISANPQLAGQIDTLQYLLKSHAEPKISNQCPPYVDRPNDVWGWGILDIHAAVQAAVGLNLGWLDGTVTDASTAQPVAGARLQLTADADGWTFLDRYTNAQGYYTFTALPAATYQVTATAYSYLPATANVTIQGATTTTQNLALQTAPLWTVSGYVTEEGTGAPLRATLTFEGTPVVVSTDPATGFYSADIYQGDFWTAVRSPGHATELAKLSVYGDLTQDFDLTPIYNYYMRTSEAPCGPTFGWIDATGGTPHPLSDDSNVYLDFPGAATVTFYGQTYSGGFIGSNGILTFGAGNSKWPGPIPDPATPNNGIYAFGTDLNPANGAQGNIYDLQVGNLLVIEWYQVQHYPSGDPETFEIIIDLDTGAIWIQYLVVSNPTDVFPGVENAAGTEATAYPGLPQANLALAFYPAYSTSPAEQGVGTLAGTVIDAETSAPLAGALVEAQDFLGNIVTDTTEPDGAYSMDLCADFYVATASADGYVTSVPQDVIVFAGDTTTADFALTPLFACDPPTMVDFSWTPQEPMAGKVVTFTAAATGTEPLIYAWDFGDGAIGIGKTAEHTYAADGLYSVTLVVSNDCGQDDAEHQVLVATPIIVPPAPVPPVGLYPGGEAYNSFTIANTGTADLAWSLAEDPDATWLEEDTVSGVIAPGESVDVQITYTAPLTPGLYTTVLRITSNDPLSPSVDVPIEMEVAQPCDRVVILAITPTIQGCRVTFVAEVSGTPPIDYLWAFGDGVTSTAAMPTHNYAQTGTYNGTLEVQNCGGDGYQLAPFTVQVECVPLQPRIYLPLVFKGYTP